MENSRIRKIMMQCKPRGHRRPGRPLRRLLDGAETAVVLYRANHATREIRNMGLFSVGQMILPSPLQRGLLSRGESGSIGHRVISDSFISYSICPLHTFHSSPYRHFKCFLVPARLNRLRRLLAGLKFRSGECQLESARFIVVIHLHKQMKAKLRDYSMHMTFMFNNYPLRYFNTVLSNTTILLYLY
ncbi:hypothetical protein ANN_14852 [Periplaneta americana]|uniref:Uncharacterized protein n=1 Tax=Periplaneta americana TaxID=6978 RepID=A0ABQ8SXF6_PERAM|nr:hypothetical protein ANN_14852 [Periplaneta americana]